MKQIAVFLFALAIFGTTSSAYPYQVSVIVPGLKRGPVPFPKKQ